MTLKWPPAARTTDPITSREAEASLGGARQTHCSRILQVVRTQPGLVSGEIAQITGLGMHITSRRLADLKNQDIIGQSGARVWSGSGRRQGQWWPRDYQTLLPLED